MLDVGTVDVNPHRSPLLSINNAHLKAGTHLVLAFPEMPQKIAEAIIWHKTKPPQMAESGQSAYAIKLLHYMCETSELAVGIVGSNSQFKLNKDRVYANLDGDGFKETFRVAYSQEGAHLTVWSGQPLLGKRKWHGYFHFDYEVEPNSTAKDY